MPVEDVRRTRSPSHGSQTNCEVREEESTEGEQPTHPESSSSSSKATTITGAELLAHPRESLPFGKRLKLHAITLGSTVAQSMSAALVATKLGATVCIEAGECAALATAAQVSSAGAVVMRMPMDGARGEQFCGLVRDFTVANEAAAVTIAEMSTAQQVLTVGMQANALAAVATAAVQQSLNVAFFMTGSVTKEELKHESVMISLSAGGTVVGGTAGAALGTLVFPGAGTAVGSLIGSYAGAFAPMVCNSRANQNRIAEEERTAMERPLKTVPAMDGDWLEVVDCSAESMVAFHVSSSALGEDGGAASMMVLGSPAAADEVDTTSSSAAAGNRAVDDTTASPIAPVRPDEVLLVWEICDAEEEE